MDANFNRKDILNCHISDFLKSLNTFKTVYNSSDHFKNNLLNIHKNFIKLKNVFRNKNEIVKVKEDKDGDFIKYTIGNIELIKHEKHGFISVNTGNTELNEFLIKKRHNDLLEESVKFFNFETTVCDFCGKLGFEIPKNKFLSEEEVLSFHDKCVNLLKNHL
ncbi:uncharacterized protein VNE69_03302 [Vairimorpha necatrix]|uniref:Uncharacterized protein n=1 Tax=Vairimorpha necatrix TaxID=6039 RepID=A0AAX4JB42_9MICR